MTTTKRAAIYVRVSSAGQEDNTSLKSQEQDCRVYAARQRWTVVEPVYQDVQSGADLHERAGLSRLLADMKLGRFDVVLVWRFDRLSREMNHRGYIFTCASDAGVKITSINQQVDDSPEGQIHAAIDSYADARERRAIADRTDRGKRARIESGKPLVGQRAAYGYRWNDEERKERLVEKPDTAWIVRRIFEEAVQGKPLKAIARGLNDESLPTPNGAPIWMKGRISDILKDTRYKGEQYGKRTRAEKVPGQRHYRQVRLPKEEWFRLEDVPALVDAATWQRANERLELNRHVYERRETKPDSALAAGLVYCGHCGGRMTKADGGLRYQCQRNYRQPGACSFHGIRVEELDAAVWQRAKALLLHPEMIEAEYDRQRQDESHQARIDEIEHFLASVDRKAQRLALSIADEEDDYARAVLQSSLRDLSQQRSNAEQESDRLRAMISGAEAVRAQMASLVQYLRRRSEGMDSWTHQQKKDALMSLGVQARVFRQSHEPRYEILSRLDDRFWLYELPEDGGTTVVTEGESGPLFIRDDDADQADLSASTGAADPAGAAPFGGRCREGGWRCGRASPAPRASGHRRADHPTTAMPRRPGLPARRCVLAQRRTVARR